MGSLRERLFILDSEHRKRRNKVQDINLRVFYGWSKMNKIRKKEAISVIFENDRQSEERTLRTVGKFQDTVYIRKQTDGEKQDAKHSSRMFTEYSVFMDDKRIKGSLEAALLINRNADRKNVSKKVLDEIEAELRSAYLMVHRDYKEPVRQLELFTLTD